MLAVTSSTILEFAMPRVTMDTMTSSVLREANNSLMAGHVMTSVRSEYNSFPEFADRQAPDDQHSAQPVSYKTDCSTDLYPIFEPASYKQQNVDVSVSSNRSNVLLPHCVGRSCSSPPGQITEDTTIPAPNCTSDTDTDICDSWENFPSLYNNVSRQSVLSFTSLPTDQFHLNHEVTTARCNNSRSGVPADRSTKNIKDLTTLAITLESRHDNKEETSLYNKCIQPYLNDTCSTIQQAGDEYRYANHRHDSIQVNSCPAMERDTTQHKSNSRDSIDILVDAKLDDSDYSNMSTDRLSNGCSSATSYQLDHSHNNNKCGKYDYRHLSSTPSSMSTPIPSPSSSSQTFGDTQNDDVRDNKFDNSFDLDHGLETMPEVKAEKVKGKGAMKPRGAQNLPPCRVCGNMASGLHFGVNTCEACNEFFRRSLKRGASYYCSKNRECQVYGKKRNACSFCRYQRCIEMGMSRDAIKTGRYSHKTRTEYAMEVENFKLREVSRVEHQKFEILLSDLVRYHDKYVKVTTRVPDEDLLRNQSSYLDLYQTHREHERRHPPLTTAAANKRLLDDWPMAKEDLSLTMHDAEMTEKWLRNYISYAKNVPGFKELALSDQASLVRGSWFEFWFLGAFRGYNSKLQVVAYPNGRCFHKEEIQKVFGKEYTDFSFHLADRMRSLEVSPEVMVLVKTVCLTFPDRTPLDNKEAVDEMHWLMVSCLLHTLDKIRPSGASMFPLIVSKLVELRTLTDIAMRAHKSVLFQDVLKDSPLLCEMVDTKTRYVQSVNNNTVTVTGDT